MLETRKEGWRPPTVHFPGDRPMSHFDSCRRAGSIVLVVACLLLVPGAAMARFTDREAPALSVSTDSMERPAAVAGTYTCGGQGNTESVRIDVTGFTDTGPSGAPHTYSPTPGNPAPVVTTTSRTQSLTASIPDDKAANVWTVSIQSVLGNWTGPAYSRQGTCPRKSGKTGPPWGARP